MLEAMIYKPYGSLNDITIHIYKNADRIMIECNVDVTNLDAELNEGETLRDICAKLGLNNPSLQIVTRNETLGINEITISYSNLNRDILYTTFASHIMKGLRSIYVDVKFNVVNGVTNFDVRAQRVFWSADRSEVAVMNGDNICYIKQHIENSIVKDLGITFVSVTGSTFSIIYRW